MVGSAQMSLRWVVLERITTSFRNLTGGNYFREFPKLNRMGIGINRDIGPELDTGILPRKLVYLFVPEARLEKFPNLSATVPRLKHLRIYKNRIQTIPNEYIAGLNRMETLHINKNLLTLLPDLGFMTRLKDLLLHENKLAGLPDMYHLPLENLNVAGNPLVCDQALCWLRMWPWKKKMALKGRPVYAAPDTLAGIRLMAVPPVVMKCYQGTVQAQYMMTSSNGTIFRVTGHLCGEFTGPRWIPRTKASDAELWCFHWSASE